MSRYYNEVTFYLGADPGAPVKKVEKALFNKDKLTTAIAAIREEFERISNGTSELTHYPISTGNFGFPAANRLKILEMDPCKKNYLAFLELAKQDLGQKAAVFFMTLLRDAQID